MCGVRISRGKIVLDEHGALAERERGFDHRGELAHVARPVVALEARHRARRDAVDAATAAGVEHVDELLDEQRDVAAARPERRQVQRDDAKLVGEVGAEATARDLVVERGARRGDHADVDRLRRRSVERRDHAGVEGAEQAGLGARWKLGHLVEEERELDARRVRQEQVLEGAVRRAARRGARGTGRFSRSDMRVDRGGERRLARPRFAVEEHVRFALRDLRREREEALHDRIARPHARRAARASRRRTVDSSLNVRSHPPGAGDSSRAASRARG